MHIARVYIVIQYLCTFFAITAQYQTYNMLGVLSCRGQRIVSHGRPDGGHLLLADIQRLRQEEVCTAVAQLSGAVPAKSHVLLRDPTAHHTGRSPGAHIHHAAIQPSGVDQDGSDESRRRRSKARRTKGILHDINTYIYNDVISCKTLRARSYLYVHGIKLYYKIT